MTASIATAPRIPATNDVKMNSVMDFPRIIVCPRGGPKGVGDCSLFSPC
jgi:hypothetical protein